MTLDVQNLSGPRWSCRDSRVEPVENGFEQAQADLNVKLVEQVRRGGASGRYGGSTDFATDLFVEETMSSVRPGVSCGSWRR